MGLVMSGGWVRLVPGIAGGVLLAAGAALVYLPAGLIVAGGLLLIVDREV